MSGLGTLGFAAPWALIGLVALPAIWWLIRVVPPRPRQQVFPPTRILFRIGKREETPSRSPWWLTALRLGLATLVILAVAGPRLGPGTGEIGGSGPVVLVVDNGWTAANDWAERVGAAERILADAARAGRPVALVGSADPVPDLTPDDAEAIGRRLAALRPMPWLPDRGALAATLAEAFGGRGAGFAWIADGLENGAGGAFAERLAALSAGEPVAVYGGDPARTLALTVGENSAEALMLEVQRGRVGPAANGTARALDLNGRVVATAPFAFEAGAETASAWFELPSELRNDITRVEIVEQSAAGAVQLLDERWRRRVVGLVSGESTDLAQPLLSPLYYVEKALSPFADLRRPRATVLTEALDDLIGQKVSAIIMTDIGTLPETAEAALDKWVLEGGMLIRFAGPRLAGGVDRLVPVGLRGGDRILGGSLSWQQPQHLAPFPQRSPFAGLSVPGDVTISRQVLAEPAPDLADKTWAELTDGTPLVTAEAHGAGKLVLFHVTANTTWSNLPLSGTFIEMLRRSIALATVSAGAGGDATAAERPADATMLPPLRLIDGFGRFGPLPATAEPIAATGIDAARADPRHPPGFYGSSDAFGALNAMVAGDRLVPLDLVALGGSVAMRTLAGEAAIDLRRWLFLAAIALLAMDFLAVLYLSGAFTTVKRARATVLLVIGASVLIALTDSPRAAETSADDAMAIEALRETRFAYVITGNAALDDISRRGLVGLSQFLTERTSLEPGDPFGVDLARDELTYFPLIYWPVDAASAVPGPDVIARIDAYMKNGGTVLFDTRDALTTLPGVAGEVGPATLKLRQLLAGLDVPELAPVAEDHVLTKAFYILHDFPGRSRDGRLWVEALPEPEEGAEERRPARSGDGVSAILITGNDFAGAWAVDDDGKPMFATLPPDPMQREWAYRVGVNIVMYVLTGNYKADQVHIPALLERLGQ